MRIIALEEHYAGAAIAATSAPTTGELSPGFAAAYAPGSGLNYAPPPQATSGSGRGHRSSRPAPEDGTGRRIAVQAIDAHSGRNRIARQRHGMAPRRDPAAALTERSA